MYSRASGLLTAIFKADGSHWLAMANKPKRRRRRLHVALCDETLALGALAVKDVVSNPFNSNVDRPEFCLSIKGTWNIIGLTAGQGPVQFGIAHGDYSAQEIEEHIEASGSWGQDDKIAAERAGRLVRQIGQFDDRDGDGEEIYLDGQEISTKCRFMLMSGAQLQIWARSLAGGTLTTGAIIQFVGKAFLVPN